jgi:hypothetical protein
MAIRIDKKTHNENAAFVIDGVNDAPVALLVILNAVRIQRMKF